MPTCNFDDYKQLNYLKSLSSEEQLALRNKSRQLSLSKGSVIFREAENIQKPFCIRESACKFSKIDDKGNEPIVRLLGKGDLMGRKSIVMNKGASVTATAITDTSLCMVGKKVVLNHMKMNNRFCMDVLKGLIGHTEQNELQKTLFLNYNSIKNRLAGLLFYLIKKFGLDPEGYLMVRLKREEMASLLRTSSEYIIKLLGMLSKQKYMQLGPQGVSINSKKKLQSLIC